MLDQALPVFLAHGYQRTTVEQLARASGVTKRTIYSDYGDKAGLFAAMVADVAATISRDGGEDDDTLAALATRILYRIQSDELVGLHRLVIGESRQFPELVRMFHDRADQLHIETLRDHLLAEHGLTTSELASPLFSLLLGSAHRRRLFGVTPAPTEAEAAELASTAIAMLGLV